MEIIDLVKRFAGHSGVAAVQKVWSDDSVRTMHFKGLSASATPMLFAALASAEKPWQVPVALFVLNDLEEAGYFYHDLVQMLSESQVLFLPSSYKRAIKYGQKDPANEVLRTEVLTRLAEAGKLTKLRLSEGKDCLQALPSVATSTKLIENSKLKNLVGQQITDNRQQSGHSDGNNSQFSKFVQTSESQACLNSHCESSRTKNECLIFNSQLYIVSYPDALAEMVVSRDTLSDRSIALAVGDTIEITNMEATLMGEGFERVDYVYEPGQFAVRGSIIDVFSYASEYPFRIDLFGDEIDSIRTFEIETQLSRDKVSHISIVPNFDGAGEQGQVSFFDFLPEGSALAFQDYFWVHERMEQLTIDNGQLTIGSAMKTQPDGNNCELSIVNCQLMKSEDFIRKTQAFRRIEFGTKASTTVQATVTFETSPQPLFHKNFELVEQSLTDLISRGYQLYILTDSAKQAERLKTIFEERGDDIPFTAVDKTIHGGFTDATMRVACFTDHQIFDRFHKYNLRSDRARSGKMAISLKELSPSLLLYFDILCSEWMETNTTSSLL